MPTYPADKKLSKNEILRLAIKYIKNLMEVLDKLGGGDSNQMNDNQSYSSYLNDAKSFLNFDFSSNSALSSYSDDTN